MNTKDFKFDERPIYQYVNWHELLASGEPILKKYVIWVTGFYYYAGGVTGVNRWKSFKVLNGTGWNSRPEAQAWAKENGIKQYSVASRDPYGKGSKAQSVRVMRLDKFIKYILDDNKSWYERSQGVLPSEAEIVK